MLTFPSFLIEQLPNYNFCKDQLVFAEAEEGGVAEQ